MKYIEWKIESGPDDSHLVVGEHKSYSLKSEPVKREVYQFESLAWAVLCKNYVERLSPNRFYYAGTSGQVLTYRGDWTDGCSATGSLLSPQFLLDSITPSMLLTILTRPFINKAKQVTQTLLWGEKGKK